MGKTNRPTLVHVGTSTVNFHNATQQTSTESALTFSVLPRQPSVDSLSDDHLCLNDMARDLSTDSLDEDQLVFQSSRDTRNASLYANTSPLSPHQATPYDDMYPSDRAALVDAAILTLLGNGEALAGTDACVSGKTQIPQRENDQSVSLSKKLYPQLYDSLVDRK